MSSPLKMGGHRHEQATRAEIEHALTANFAGRFLDANEDTIGNSLAAVRRQVTKSSDPNRRRLSLAAALYLLHLWLQHKPVFVALVCFVDREKGSDCLDARAFAHGVGQLIESRQPVPDVNSLYVLARSNS